MAIRIELTHNPHLLSFVPGIITGKLKMNIKVVKHGATTTGGIQFGISSICSHPMRKPPEGGRLCTVSQAEERAGDGGNGFRV